MELAKERRLLLYQCILNFTERKYNYITCVMTYNFIYKKESFKEPSKIHEYTRICMMNSSVNKSSSPTFLPTTSTHRHTQRQQQLYIKKWSLYNVELASRRVPGPLCQTKQKPASPGHRELPPEVTEVLSPSLPGPARPSPRLQRT